MRAVAYPHTQTAMAKVPSWHLFQDGIYINKDGVLINKDVISLNKDEKRMSKEPYGHAKAVRWAYK